MAENNGRKTRYQPKVDSICRQTTKTIMKNDMPTQPIPASHHSVTPYIIVNGGNAAIAFYVKAFVATELMRMAGPGGKIGHAELKTGDSNIMLAAEYPEKGFRSSKTIGGTGGSLLLYTEDIDRTYNTAITEGEKILQPIKDQFYGDRSKTLENPFGNV